MLSRWSLGYDDALAANGILPRLLICRFLSAEMGRENHSTAHAVAPSFQERLWGLVTAQLYALIAWLLSERGICLYRTLIPDHIFRAHSTAIIVLLLSERGKREYRSTSTTA